MHSSRSVQPALLAYSPKDPTTQASAVAEARDDHDAARDLPATDRGHGR